MLVRVFVLLISFLKLCTAVPTSSPDKWATHSAVLHENARLLWAPSVRDVTFELQAPTKGYVALGLSSDTRNPATDLVVGWVKDGHVFLQDRHITEDVELTKINPRLDSSQDYQLLLGYENATHTVIRFRRKLNTCDDHDIAITNDTILVTWMIHPEKPISGDTLPSFSSGISGSQNMHLLQTPRTKQHPSVSRNEEELASTWEVRNSQVDLSLSDAESLNWCRVFRAPLLLRKHHIIRYEPVIEGDLKHIKQMFLYECQETNEITKPVEDPGRPCYEPGNLPLSCDSVVAEWSSGSTGFEFPPEAGYPLEPSSSIYYMLETHYIVPENSFQPGKKYSSGLKLYYTPELRKFDAGMISIGIEPSWRHIIPPGQPRVLSIGHCASECTKRALPQDGIHVFGVVPQRTRHLGLVQRGNGVKLKHVRGNNELPPLSPARLRGQSVAVLPGDHLIAECEYDSRKRAAITLGGGGGRHETCLAAVLYYPRQKKLATCRSAPSLASVLQSLGIQRLQPNSYPLKIAEPPELTGMTLEHRLLSYDWKEQFRNFQDVTLKGSFKPVCLSADSSMIAGTDTVEYFLPNITKPYVPPAEDECWSRRRPPELDRPPLSLEGNHLEGLVRNKVSRSSSFEDNRTQQSYSGAACPQTGLARLLLSVVVLCYTVYNL